MNKKTLVWFRQDLRLYDNPALFHAAISGDIIPFYHYDKDINPKEQIGSAGKLWLYHSLCDLDNSLNGNLFISSGNLYESIINICKKYNISDVNFNKCYEPWRIRQDNKLVRFLDNIDVKINIYNGSLLWNPLNILKDDKTPYKVFTPFYKKGCLNQPEPSKPLEIPKLTYYKIDESLSIDELNLIPKNNWYKKIEKYWDINEGAGLRKLDEFINNGLNNYKNGRNYPSKKNVSQLSPYLHWGQVSPNTIWNKVNNNNECENISHFKSELGWREFSYYLLNNNPDIQTKNIQSKFDNFPWDNNLKNFEAWKKGNTGIPIVDAGMRELWETGYMHNRVRMIVGSFLVKNLLIDWKYGEEWFRDCLVDADLASNSASWQWIAGCGADAAPYFRIFNPVTQGEKFDSEGVYTKRFIPELKDIPSKYLFCPWECPQEILSQHNFNLGIDYPYPIVDLKESRNRALDAFSVLKK